MKIDSHQHFWIFNQSEYDWIDDSMINIRRDFLPGHLATELGKLGFDGSIAVQARQSLEETEWLLHLAESNPIIKGVVGWVDLQSVDVYSQLEKYSRHTRFVGVRHVVQDEAYDDFILRENFNRGISYLKEFNLTYDILVFPKQLPYAVRFIEKHPDLTFVLDHIAKPFIKKGLLSPWKEDIQRISLFPNVFCKVSGMVTEADWHNWKPDDFKPYLDVIVNSFGTDRVMIGSDWPVCLVAGEYSKVMNIVLDYISGFSEEDKSKISGINCIKAYRITP
jgi:L-fuconolactonase